MMDKTTADPGKIDVRYVAHLARLNLTDEETRVFQSQLDHVVGYVRKISELDPGNVEPTSHAVAVQNIFREDAARPGLGHEQVMENAPAKVSGMFQVPKIVE